MKELTYPIQAYRIITWGNEVSLYRIDLVCRNSDGFFTARTKKLIWTNSTRNIYVTDTIFTTTNEDIICYDLLTATRKMDEIRLERIQKEEADIQDKVMLMQALVKQIELTSADIRFRYNVLEKWKETVIPNPRDLYEI